jgi:hypothetical protein
VRVPVGWESRRPWHPLTRGCPARHLAPENYRRTDRFPCFSSRGSQPESSIHARSRGWVRRGSGGRSGDGVIYRAPAMSAPLGEAAPPTVWLLEDDLEAVVGFSLRAREPVFVSIQAVLGDEIFLCLHPDWRSDQEETVRSICMNDERDVYVAVAGARPVGFVAVALHAFHECMGVIEIIGVSRLSEAGRRRPTHRVRRRPHAPLWHGHRGGRDGRRPRAHTRSCVVRRRGLHAPADRPLLPAARLTQLLAVRARRGTFPHARARARVSPIAAHIDSLRQWPQPVNGVA